MWSAVGLYLVCLTFEWIKPTSARVVATMVIIAAGIVLEVTIYRFGFSKLAKKNIDRIDKLKSEITILF
ncbi:MAG: hypothetical protein IMY76_04460 [Chloroflexi bacterium]|nr:hypothetical protein [Chloroflexota bacterium]